MADDYESLAEKTELTYEEALALKEEIRKRGENGQLATSGYDALGRSAADVIVSPLKWRVTTSINAGRAAEFLNTPPAQEPGEAMVANRGDGRVDVYWYGRLTLGG